MIENKQDYREYLRCDRIALRKNSKRPRPVHDIIWKYQILLRKCEYYENCRRNILDRVWKKALKLRLTLLSHKLGFSIPLNVFGKGLYIAHYGSIVVNENSRVGDWCRIHEGTCIGADGKDSGAPVIGNNVFIATGAKIIGNVRIADGVAIGANAVVVKDILEPNTTWGGIPAKKISNKGSAQYILPAADIKES